MAAPPVQIVWYKRDLRVTDHAPLADAAARGPVLPLFVVEPELWAQPDAAERQWAFVRESLAELGRDLAALGRPLVVRTGAAEAVLADLLQRFPSAVLHSHAETGNGWTFARDRRVAALCRERGVAWHEHRQDGVIRGLADRDGWARRRDRSMRRPPLPRPHRLDPVPDIEPGTLPGRIAGVAADSCPGRQRGGRDPGLDLLHGFLRERGRPYRRAMSAPSAAERHGSRLSPHLAWGTLSAREILHAASAARIDHAGDREWIGAIDSFTSRMAWRCHFMQKLESEPEIEHRALHPAYEGLRDADPALLDAWARGRTGWPFVDACMRCLDATGWLNFRMRAMVQSVACYLLWLDWRATGLVLARRFTDYEPGIHWPQAQMQAGTTGINTPRIYNPVKQGQDHDPNGSFIRRWIPELARVPAQRLHTPWTMTPLEQAESGCRIGVDYPAPVVDHLVAARAARDRIWAIRRSPDHGPIADAIQLRHGSRRSGLPQVDEQRRVAIRLADPQLTLGL